MQVPWKNQAAPLIAFVVLALAGGFGIKASADSSADSLYQTQLDSCHRGNTLREESNRRVRAHEIDRDALLDFLKTAETARLSAYDRDGNKSDLAAAEDYRQLHNRVQTQVVFQPVSIVDCEKVIDKP